MLFLFFGFFSWINLNYAQKPYECSGSTGHKIALTFDDGPRPNRTEHVLTALSQRNTPATFFVLGAEAQRHRDLLEETAQAHPIANHGWSHLNYSKAPLAQQKEDLQRSTEELESFLELPWKFRLPYGAGYRGDPQRLVESWGYQHIYWTIDPRDWDAQLTPEQSLERILAGAEKVPNTSLKGHIVVLHDVQAKTAAHIGHWIERIEETGHCLVPLAEVL